MSAAQHAPAPVNSQQSGVDRRLRNSPSVEWPLRLRRRSSRRGDANSASAEASIQRTAIDLLLGEFGLQPRLIVTRRGKDSLHPFIREED